MNTLINVKVGDILAHRISGHDAPTKRTVLRVGKVHVTDSVGTKWRIDGTRMGSHGYSYVKPWTAEDDTHVDEREAARSASKLAELLAHRARFDRAQCAKHADAIRALIEALTADGH